MRRGQNKTRLTTQTKALDNTQTKTKNRHKNKQARTSANLPKKDTKRDTSMRDLYGQLETLVQDHIENQLKHRHNGQLPYKRFSRYKHMLRNILDSQSIPKMTTAPP